MHGHMNVKIRNVAHNLKVSARWNEVLILVNIT
jgi:hypothetical protein